MWQRHFERMADDYATARPPYPAVLYDTLVDQGVAGPGLEVLEIGAGAGLATAELVARGSFVTAVEPGERLAALLRESVPSASVIVGAIEEAVLPSEAYDAVAAATSLHWVDLDVVLPMLHRVLRPGGKLAVWRTSFGDPSAPVTPFREAMDRIVRHPAPVDKGTPREDRPTLDELTSAGWFEGAGRWEWPWAIDLSTDQIHRLFSTFSNWSESEVDAAAAEVDALGGRVTEHYRTVLTLLRRSSSSPRPDRGAGRRAAGARAS